MKRLALVVLLELAAACSGSVDVHGIPQKIALEVPGCTPPKDAGSDAAP